VVDEFGSLAYGDAAANALFHVVNEDTSRSAR
jgi:hypothetical protein